MMKGIFNLLFIFMMTLTFSPLKSIADCHQVEKTKDDCHHCHEDTSEQNQENKSHEQGHKDCEMACCHMAFTEVKPVQIVLIEPRIFNSTYPIYLSRALSDYREELLRPPIA